MALGRREGFLSKLHSRVKVSKKSSGNYKWVYIAMRHYDDWLTAFMDYASFGEAPRYMYFWAGVSAVAGALRRKVWIDQAYFKWYPNFYIILVAPPGIVSKSTTSNTAISLLREVPGVNFGPDVVTMPALLQAFEEKLEGFEYAGGISTMCALTLEASEFGNLLDPGDKAMVDMLVSLWDAKPGVMEKRTKGCGNDKVENPWINLIACTTPAWIAGNFPEYMLGGGFTSRCIFVYADKKEKLVAYPGLSVPHGMADTRQKLIEDLTDISKLVGEYKLTPDAVAWGEQWYEAHYNTKKTHLDDEHFGGYIARKQTHVHKIAIVLAASGGTNLLITDEHLAIAAKMVTDLESDMKFVFEKVGKSDSSTHADRLIWFVRSRGRIAYHEAYRHVHTYFPSMRDFEDVLAGCIKAGYLKLEKSGGIDMLSATHAAEQLNIKAM